MGSLFFGVPGCQRAAFSYRQLVLGSRVCTCNNGLFPYKVVFAETEYSFILFVIQQTAGQTPWLKWDLCLDFNQSYVLQGSGNSFDIKKFLVIDASVSIFLKSGILNMPEVQVT